MNQVLDELQRTIINDVGHVKIIEDMINNGSIIHFWVYEHHAFLCETCESSATHLIVRFSGEAFSHCMCFGCIRDQQ